MAVSCVLTPCKLVGDKWRFVRPGCSSFSWQKSEISDIFEDGGGTPRLHSREELQQSPAVETDFRLIHLPHLRKIIRIHINTTDVRNMLFNITL